MSASLYVNPRHVVAVSPVQRAEGGATWFFDVYFTVESHLTRHALAFAQKDEADVAQARLVQTLEEFDHDASEYGKRSGSGRAARKRGKGKSGLLGCLAR